MAALQRRVLRGRGGAFVTAALDPRRDLTPTKCPSCGYKLDAATCPDDESKRPQPGDLSVCFNCTAILSFDERLKPVTATEAEIRSLPVVTRVRFALLRQTIQHFHASRRRS